MTDTIRVAIPAADANDAKRRATRLVNDPPETGITCFSEARVPTDDTGEDTPAVRADSEAGQEELAAGWNANRTILTRALAVARKALATHDDERVLEDPPVQADAAEWTDSEDDPDFDSARMSVRTAFTILSSSHHPDFTLFDDAGDPVTDPVRYRSLKSSINAGACLSGEEGWYIVTLDVSEQPP